MSLSPYASGSKPTLHRSSSLSSLSSLSSFASSSSEGSSLFDDEDDPEDDQPFYYPSGDLVLDLPTYSTRYRVHAELFPSSFFASLPPPAASETTTTTIILEEGAPFEWEVVLSAVYDPW